MNRTFVMLKPDAIARQLDKEILDFFTARGLTIARQALVKVKKTTILRHYDEVITRIGKGPFRQYVINEFVGQTVLIAELHSPRENLIELVRTWVGATDPVLAHKESIRGLYGEDSLLQARNEERMLRNLIHASDSKESVDKEIALWFGDK
jgi:nucleoside-diphosphate kinase